MRVVHHCSVFSTLSETFIYDYVTELERQGVDTHVLTHRRENAERRPFEQVVVLPWPSSWGPRRIGYRLLELAGLREVYTSYWTLLRPVIKNELLRIRPDVIHAHFGRMGAMMAPIASALDIPLVVTFYGYDISELPRQKRWQKAYEKIWHTAQAIVVLSEEMKHRAIKCGAPLERVQIVHLARDLEVFSYRPPNPPIRELVSVGRLTEKKGHLDAIRAIQRLVQEGQDLYLRIVGGGALYDQLDRYIRDNNLQDHVELTGAQPNEKVAGYLRGADAFILCSKTAPSGDREGTPTVLIEAQAVGLPCISTRHAGIPEMIPADNHRLLAEEGNVDQIVESLDWLLKQSHEKVHAIAEAGREKVEMDFHIVQEVNKLYLLYKNLIK